MFELTKEQAEDMSRSEWLEWYVERIDDHLCMLIEGASREQMEKALASFCLDHQFQRADMKFRTERGRNEVWERFFEKVDYELGNAWQCKKHKYLLQDDEGNQGFCPSCARYAYLGALDHVEG